MGSEPIPLPRLGRGNCCLREDNVFDSSGSDSRVLTAAASSGLPATRGWLVRTAGGMEKVGAAAGVKLNDGAVARSGCGGATLGSCGVLHGVLLDGGWLEERDGGLLWSHLEVRPGALLEVLKDGGVGRGEPLLAEAWVGRACRECTLTDRLPRLPSLRCGLGLSSPFALTGPNFTTGVRVL